MQKWEYLVTSKNLVGGKGYIDTINGERVVRPVDYPAWAFLRQRGSEGWELVSVVYEEGRLSGEFWYFKRPISN